MRKEIGAVKEESVAVREEVRGQIKDTTCKLLKEMNVLRKECSERAAR